MPWNDTDVSKYLSYILRHNPADAGIVLDDSGWAQFERVFAAVHAKFGLEQQDLIRIIQENPKKRFTLDGVRVRAAQGHSLDVNLGLNQSNPPETLYHGTTNDSWQLIRNSGIKAMSRNHVHLSHDIATANIVAKRRNGPHLVLQVNAAAMHTDGYKFYLSDNNVWLCESVPTKYIKPLTETLP